MRYNSLHNSKKQPNDRQRGWDTPSFHIKLACFAYCFAHWCPAGLYQHTQTFWSLTLQPLVADQSTIPHKKGDIHGFHMRHKNLIWNMRLQSYRVHTRLYIFCLVLDNPCLKHRIQNAPSLYFRSRWSNSSIEFHMCLISYGSIDNYPIKFKD